MFNWLNLNSNLAARRLLGCQFIREFEGGLSATLQIVETESYDETDAASHSFRGVTARTKVMFGPAGHLYVYFTYGMHFCMNVVVGGEGHGEAVLIRALEPISGIDILREYRPVNKSYDLTNGPAKLTQALNINKSFNGHDLSRSPLKLVRRPALVDQQIVIGPRIGISKEIHKLRRFYIKDNPYVSR